MKRIGRYIMTALTIVMIGTLAACGGSAVPEISGGGGGDEGEVAGGPSGPEEGLPIDEGNPGPGDNAGPGANAGPGDNAGPGPNAGNPDAVNPDPGQNTDEPPPPEGVPPNPEDPDDDDDGILDPDDNCPMMPNADQADLDRDGTGDVCDADMDGDGVANAQDAFPANPAEQADNDLDGIGDNADQDDDNDGVVDAIDSLPLVANQGNIPTNGTPSPLFGAGEFEQQMVLFEEFGPQPFDPLEPAPTLDYPDPRSAVLGPDPDDLHDFLAESGMAPYATRLAADEATYQNPWQDDIEDFLGRALETPPAEGRPQGEDWAHQRWDEFYPQKYFKTAQGGAGVNTGFRDSRQRHGYAVGEFGPGGLYHTVYTSSVSDAPTLVATTNGLPVQVHPRMPVQGPDAVWTFDGALPPKLLQVRYGEAVLMRHYNALPIDNSANRGFGANTITTHEHNGHQPGESDGFTGAFYFPGQFYDYRWPLQLAGYDLINTGASDPRAAFPCEAGEQLPVDDDNDHIPTLRSCADGRIQLRGDWRETMSTHWFHDHMLDHTAENVYKGNAVMMNYYSALDRGNEAINDGVNLRFPSGTALNWGNRDYDVNLLVADKAWDRAGQLWFSHDEEGGHDGFLGDRMTANWLYKPYLDVRARRYRFRILDGAVSRIMAIALVEQVPGDSGEIPGPAGSGVSYNRAPFHMIANDGNVMEHAIPFDGSIDLDGDGDLLEHKGILPSQTIAERYDIVVDFSRYAPGTRLYFLNIMEHFSGKVTNRKVPLEEILSGTYRPQLLDDNLDGISDHWINGDPAVGKFLELRVKEYAGADLSMNPADYEPGKLKMIPLPIDRNDPALATAARHSFEFVRSEGGSATPWKVRVDGSDELPMDPRRVSALMDGSLEIWTISGGGGWTHPVHIHFEEGVYLTRAGALPPAWEFWARKDMYRIGPEDDSGFEIEVALRAREFAGTFVEHCHNTMHEDHAMLLRWDSTLGRPDIMETPMPTWDGVLLESSEVLMP